MSTRDSNRIEFGDFQTPKTLAASVVQALAGRGVGPASIVEPTCGTGAFLEASLEQFSMIRRAVGLEINPEYFRIASERIVKLHHPAMVDVRQADFFRYDWKKVFQDLPEPILVVGNPPWVTHRSWAYCRARTSRESRTSKTVVDWTLLRERLTST